MQKNDFINELADLEMQAEMLEQKASMIKKEAHKARAKLAGVSTPAVRKGFNPKITNAVANRNRHIQRSVK